MSDLKPKDCPVCAQPAFVTVHAGKKYASCTADGCWFGDESGQWLIEIWNRRTPDASRDEVVDDGQPCYAHLKCERAAKAEAALAAMTESRDKWMALASKNTGDA